MPSKTKIAKQNESRGRQLANLRRNTKLARERAMGVGSRFGGAFFGGALLGDQYELAGLVGLAGAAMKMTGRVSVLSNAMEGVGIGAAYCYGKENPPEFLQGMAATIKEKAEGVTDSL